MSNISKSPLLTVQATNEGLQISSFNDGFTVTLTIPVRVMNEYRQYRRENGADCYPGDDTWNGFLRAKYPQMVRSICADISNSFEELY